MWPILCTNKYKSGLWQSCLCCSRKKNLVAFCIIIHNKKTLQVLFVNYLQGFYHLFPPIVTNALFQSSGNLYFILPSRSSISNRPIRFGPS